MALKFLISIIAILLLLFASNAQDADLSQLLDDEALLDAQLNELNAQLDNSELSTVLQEQQLDQFEATSASETKGNDIETVKESPETLYMSDLEKLQNSLDLMENEQQNLNGKLEQQQDTDRLVKVLSSSDTQFTSDGCPKCQQQLIEEEDTDCLEWADKEEPSTLPPVKSSGSASTGTAGSRNISCGKFCLFGLSSGLLIAGLLAVTLFTAGIVVLVILKKKYWGTSQKYSIFDQKHASKNAAFTVLTHNDKLEDQKDYSDSDVESDSDMEKDSDAEEIKSIGDDDNDDAKSNTSNNELSDHNSDVVSSDDDNNSSSSDNSKSDIESDNSDIDSD